MKVRWDNEPQLKARLEQIEARLQSDSFLNNRELGGEIGFYIFDYPPQFELIVREYLESSLLQVRKQGCNFCTSTCLKNYSTCCRDEGC